MSIARIAGSEIKKTVLELGGSDPFVVLPSADLDAAAKVAVTARCQNNGQSCIAAKRFIVHADVYDAFTERFVANMRALKLGDPLAEGTDVGPLATSTGLEGLHRDRRRRRRQRGERVVRRPGCRRARLVLSAHRCRRHHSRRCASRRKKCSVRLPRCRRATDLDHAIELANATGFGLGSNVWTRDPNEQDRYIRDVQAGQVFVNGMTTSYPELPFGGVKKSGYGRELAAHGIHEFCNIKTVWVAKD